MPFIAAHSRDDGWILGLWRAAVHSSIGPKALCDSCARRESFATCEESRMHRSLTAIALCMVVQGGTAQCVDSAQLPPAVTELKHPAANAPQQTSLRPGSEFIAVAVAGTRDDAPAPRPAATSRSDEQHHPRRGGTAMLLAALALMSGIALRRFNAPGS
jgi:hypothetical protein